MMYLYQTDLLYLHQYGSVIVRDITQGKLDGAKFASQEVTLYPGQVDRSIKSMLQKNPNNLPYIGGSFTCKSFL